MEKNRNIVTIITEEIENFNAKNIAQHAKQRIDGRLNKMSSRGDITSGEAQTISKNLENLIDYLDKFDPKKSYGIKLGRFNVDPKSETVEKRGEPFVIWDRNKPYYRIWAEDREDILPTDSTGNEFWAVVRNNTLVTVMLRKDYQRESVTEPRSLGTGGMGVDDAIDDMNEFIADGGKTKTELRKDFDTQQAIAKGEEKERMAKKIKVIDGVKWIINDEAERIQKKNNPNVFVLFDDLLDYPHWDDETKKDILNSID